MVGQTIPVNFGVNSGTWNTGPLLVQQQCHHSRFLVKSDFGRRGSEIFASRATLWIR
jgi:hypothetical protein